MLEWMGRRHQACFCFCYLDKRPGTGASWHLSFCHLSIICLRTGCSPVLLQAMVCTELKKYGLRYDDLLDPLYSLVRLLIHPH